MPFKKLIVILNNASDTRLMLLVRQGDRDAYKEIYMRYYSRLCLYVLTYTDIREYAEDAVQEALIKLWEKRKTLKKDGSVSGFLHRVAYNEFVNICRKRKGLEKTIDAIKYQAYQESVEEDEGNLEDKIRLIQEVIAELPEKRKEIFLMCKQQGKSYKEVAEELQISVKTVENQMSKALSFLRENIDYETLIACCIVLT